jgi:hypothetical protein
VGTTIDVTQPPYNATGSGTISDLTAIQDACGACKSGNELFFPIPASGSPGYLVGTTAAFKIAQGTRVTGVARLPGGFAQDPSIPPSSSPPTTPPAAVNLALLPDAFGLLGPQRGHVMDNPGRIIEIRNPSMFVGSGVASVNGSMIVAMEIQNQRFQGIRAAWSDDHLASYALSDWIISDELPGAPSNSYVATAVQLNYNTQNPPQLVSVNLTVAGTPWPTSPTFRKDIFVLASGGTSSGQTGVVAQQTATNVVKITPQGGDWTQVKVGATFVLGVSLVDMDLLLLPNGHILCSTEEISSSTNAVRFFVSQDGGRTFTEQLNTRIDAANQLGSGAPSAYPLPGFNRSISGIKLLRSRQGILPYTKPGNSNRVYVLFRLRSSTTQSGQLASDYYLASSDDEFQTLNVNFANNTTAFQAMGVASINGQPNNIIDGDHGTVYELEQPPDLYVIVPYWNSGSTTAIYQVQCDTNGVPQSAPHLVATVPYVPLSGGNMFPHALRLRTGEYGLYFSASDFNQPNSKGNGAMYFMSSPDGTLGSFTGQRQLWLETGFLGGYGFPRPFRLPDGRLVVMYEALPTNGGSSQIRIFHHYGA